LALTLLPPCFTSPPGVRVAPGVASRRVALLVRAIAAPAKTASAGAAATSDVDTSQTPKALGFTMPGVGGDGVVGACCWGLSVCRAASLLAHATRL
jgi:hypothetical protein